MIVVDSNDAAPVEARAEGGPEGRCGNYNLRTPLSSA